jgi:hypothetical protein
MTSAPRVMISCTCMGISHLGNMRFDHERLSETTRCLSGNPQISAGKVHAGSPAQTSIAISGGAAGGHGQSKTRAYQTAHTMRTTNSNEPSKMSQALSGSLGCLAPAEYMGLQARY